MYAGNNLDKRGFTGTVLAHQRMHFTGFQLKLHIVQRLYARKDLCNAF